MTPRIPVCTALLRCLLPLTDALQYPFTSARILKCLTSNPATTLTVTLVDGLVFALSAFHNSMNYRSVCVYGDAEKVTDPEEKIKGLEAITDHVVQGEKRGKGMCERGRVFISVGSVIKLKVL